MNIILCIDDANGMMFNNRRQSRDKAVVEDIIAVLDGKTLFINKYSAPLFEGYNVKLCIADDFCDKADCDDFCFVENIPLSSVKNDINSIIVYKWNRLYPADMQLDIELSKPWHIASTAEFKGNSHEKITKEVYIK